MEHQAAAPAANAHPVAVRVQVFYARLCRKRRGSEYEQQERSHPFANLRRVAAGAVRKTLTPRAGGYVTAMPTNLWLLQTTLQALSAFAIAGGLIFTAIQFRHARKAQEVANFAKLVELQYQLRYIRVEHPELASVHQGDVEHLRSEREIQEHFLNLMQLSLFEIAWYAHQQAQLPEDYFNSWKKRMWQLGQEASFQRMLESPSMKIMHDDFDDYVRALLRRPTAP